eukprot:7320728-Prorocentrum_lima.AAC.1
MRITEHILRNSAFQLNTTKTKFITSGQPHPSWKNNSTTRTLAYWEPHTNPLNKRKTTVP